MTDFEKEFEPTRRDYSRRNAYWLGMAANAAYKDSGPARAEVAAWGLNDFVPFSKKSGLAVDTQGFFAANPQCVLLAFRGTQPNQVRDWMTDLHCTFTGGPVGQVHAGFHVALSSVWNDVWNWVAENRRGRPLFVTGHSLGAALACLAVARLRLERDEPVQGLYTFGQPRTGDRDFARAFDQDFEKQAFRYVNNNDVVTRVPLRSMSYSHVGDLRYFREDGRQDDVMSWWDKLKDRLSGRLHDLLAPGTDGLKDHSMDRYVENLKKNKT